MVRELVSEQVEKGFTFSDFSGKDEEIQRIKCYEITAGKRERTQKPQSIIHLIATGLDLDEVIQKIIIKKKSRSKCDVKTKCRLR